MKNILKKGSSVLLCLVELAVGILLLINPVGFTSGIIMGAGVLLLLVGCISVIKYFRTPALEAAQSQNLVKGLLASGLGVFCLLKTYWFPDSQWFVDTLQVLSMIYGIILLIIGLGKVQWTIDMIRLKKSRWFLNGISALVSLGAAAYILLTTDGMFHAQIVGMIIGIPLIISAALDLLAILFGGKDQKEKVVDAADDADKAGET